MLSTQLSAHAGSEKGDNAPAAKSPAKAAPAVNSNSKSDSKADSKAPISQRSTGAPTKPNIVFVIIDDAGADSFTRWNPAGIALPQTPVIDSLCDHGVRFSNVWSMPQCSPSRVAMMTGRYPFRTGVMNACLTNAPPRSQASPYEFTLPRLLSTAGYAMGYVGKFHLGDPVLNPEGDSYANGLGFPYFNGTPLGGASPLDTTLAGQMPPPADGAAPLYSCGFLTAEQTQSVTITPPFDVYVITTFTALSPIRMEHLASPLLLSYCTKSNLPNLHAVLPAYPPSTTMWYVHMGVAVSCA